MEPQFASLGAKKTGASGRRAAFIASTIPAMTESSTALAGIAVGSQHPNALLWRVQAERFVPGLGCHSERSEGIAGAKSKNLREAIFCLSANGFQANRSA
jgi:hypothetical protein